MLDGFSEKDRAAFFDMVRRRSAISAAAFRATRGRHVAGNLNPWRGLSSHPRRSRSSPASSWASRRRSARSGRSTMSRWTSPPARSRASSVRTARESRPCSAASRGSTSSTAASCESTGTMSPAGLRIAAPGTVGDGLPDDAPARRARRARQRRSGRPRSLAHGLRRACSGRPGSGASSSGCERRLTRPSRSSGWTSARPIRPPCSRWDSSGSSRSHARSRGVRRAAARRAGRRLRAGEKAHLIDALRTLSGRGLTMVLVEHDMQFVGALAGASSWTAGA